VTFFVILGLIGVTIALISTSVYGPGLSPDSVVYIFASRSILSGDGYQMLSGDAYVYWPPLFPSLLAGLERLGLESMTGIRYINAVVFGLIIVASGHLFLGHLKNRSIAILGTASLLVSLLLLRVSVLAWSEALFVLQAVLFIMCLQKFLTGQRFLFLVLISVIAALACLQRYIGFTFIVTGGISIIFLMNANTIKEKLSYLVFFGFVSSVPLAVWLGRNYSLNSNLTGKRPPSDTGFIENTGDLLQSVSTWLVPSNYVTTDFVQVVLVIIAVAVLAAIIIVGLRPMISDRGNNRAVRLAPIAIFVSIYVIALIAVRSTYAFYAPIGDRLLSPIYIFVLVFVLLGIEQIVKAVASPHSQRPNLPKVWVLMGVLFIAAGVLFNEWTVDRLLFYGEVNNEWILENLLSSDGSIRTLFRVLIALSGVSSIILGLLLIALRQKPWVGRIVVIGLFSIWLIYPIAQSSVYLSNKTLQGAGGYNTDSWKNSTLINHLEANPLEATIYSNDPEGIYILTQTNNDFSPKRLPYDAINDSAAEASTFEATIKSDANDTYLIWISNGNLLDPQRNLEENFDRVAVMFDLEEVAQFPDGGIYLFK